MKCTHAWHSRQKVIVGLVAQSPKGRLEVWKPMAELTKTGVLELLFRVKSSPYFLVRVDAWTDVHKKQT